MRIACLLVPDLLLAAELRAHPALRATPLAITAGAGPRAQVLSVSPEAFRLGVRPGSSVAQARAVCAALGVRRANPALDTSARAALLDAALAGAPRAEPASREAGAYAAEAAVYADATGVTALHRTEAGFATALGARAAALGLPACLAVAGSRAVAHLAARRLAAEQHAAQARAAAGRGCEPAAANGVTPDPLAAADLQVIAPGCEAAFLAPLSLDLVDPEPALASALLRFGIRRLGELARLPRRGLASRLGPGALRLAALARGEAEEPPLRTPGSQRFEEAQDLEASIDHLEPLQFVLRGLLARLVLRLETRGFACGDLELALGLEGGGRDARRVGLAAPTRELRTLLRLTGLALETQPPEAPVESVAVATEGVPERSDQLDLFRPAGPAPAVLSRTLAELAALCGADRVGAPAAPDLHRPGAYALVPYTPESMRPGAEACPTHPRPPAVRALRPPVSAEVRLRSGRPVHVRSAVANGRVERLSGPWRTSGHWWSPEARYAFDCFDVQTSDGMLARLRLDRIAQAWQIDAIYD